MKKKQLGILKKKQLNKTIKKKAEEFQNEGYEKVNSKSLWEFVLEYRWKRVIPQTISEMKIDIEKMTPNEFFDYQVICAQTLKNKKFDWNKIDDLLD